MLLVRALQKTDEADALVDRGVELDFSDTDEIASAYRGHIAVLVDAGIVEGNSRNEFLPHAQVTRGVVAAMIVRSLDYLEDEGDYLALEGYTDVTRQSGILVDYGSEQLTFRGPDGIVRRYPVAADADVTVQDGDNRLDDNLAGSRLSLRLSEGQITAVTVQKTVPTTSMSRAGSAPWPAPAPAMMSASTTPTTGSPPASACPAAPM